MNDVVRSRNLTLALLLVAGCGGNALRADLDDGGSDALDGGRDGVASVDGVVTVDASRAEVGADAGADVEDARVGDASTPPDAALMADTSASERPDGLAADATDAVSAVSPDASSDAPASDGGVGPHYLGTLALQTQPNTSATASAPGGGYYFTGSFGVPADFDPGPGTDLRTPQGQSDVFLTKVNADGSRAWTVTFGGPLSQTIVRVVIVTPSAIVLSGFFTNGVDFDPGPGDATRAGESNGSYTGYISSLTLDGKLQWVDVFDATADCSGSALAADALGNVYVGGEFSGTCDFDPTIGVDQRSSGFYPSGFLTKLSLEDGHESWTRIFSLMVAGCSGGVTGVAVAGDGDVWVTGSVGVGCGFSSLTRPTTTPSTDDGTLLASFTPAGVSVGSWDLGSGTGWAIASASDGSLYVGGAMSGVVDFSLKVPAETRTLPLGDWLDTGFVLKLAADGSFDWAQTFPQSLVMALAGLDDGGVLALSVPVPDAQRMSGFSVTRLSTDGIVLWSVPVGDGNVSAFGVAADATTFVVSGSSYDFGADVDPGTGVDLVPAGASFLSRYAF